MSDVTVTSLANLRNEVRYGAGQVLITDEPVAAGGEDAGPDPYTLLLAALGSCISMTTMLYARRKAWPVERVTVRLRQQRIHGKDCQECEQKTDGFVHRIEPWGTQDTSTKRPVITCENGQGENHFDECPRELMPCIRKI